MKLNQRLRIFFVIAFFCALCFTGADVFAQKTANVTAIAVSPVPYTVGEKLTYNVAFSNFPSAAYAETIVARRGDAPSGVELRAHVETLGIVNAALFALNKNYSSAIDTASGGAADGGVYNLLSAVYRVRALPLDLKQSYQISVRDGVGQIYDAEVRVIGRETIKTAAGSFNTLVAEMRVRGKVRPEFKNLRVYFTEDERHLPARLTAQVATGELRADIVSVELPPTPPPIANNLPQITPPFDNSQTRAVASSASLPFSSREQLNYNFYLGSAAQLVGTASLQVQQRANYFGRNGLLLTGVVETSGAGQTIFPIRDKINSYVDANSLLPFRSEVNLQEGVRRDISTLTLDQDHGSATLNTDQRIEIPVGTYDYLSAFYALRLFDLTPPKRTALALLVNNRPHTFSITALSRETIEINNQRISAIQLSITTDARNADKNKIRLWISADKRKLPLRLTAITALGVLRADLAILSLNRQ